MKPTIRSIAQLAGVSRGTVDRVVHNRPSVSPEVRERVLKVMEQTGYTRPDAKDAKPAVQIGVLIPHWTNPYFTQETRRGIDQAKRKIHSGEAKLLLQRMDSRSDDEYVRRCEKFAERGVNGLVLNAADNIVLRSVVQQLRERGTTVVTYNSDLPDSGRLCHVGQDLYRSGCVAAGLIARSLGPHDRVLIITGNMEFLSHRIRIDGFCTRLKELGFSSDRWQLRECFEQGQLTYETVERSLRQDVAIRGIYMGTESVSACMDAVHRFSNRRIHVIANDLTPHARRLLRDNELDFVIQQEFSTQVEEAILLLRNYLVYGREPQQEVYNVETSILTSELIV